MSEESTAGSSGASWRPAASLETLRLRADLLARTRAFFAARGVLEVETPALSSATVTDPHLASLVTRYAGPGAAAGRTLYLQTSPEYAMKRLLAAGSGPIFQLARAFRDGEAGRRHNPEFTLLEWYRPGFDHHALMDEMDELLAALLGCPKAERVSYRDLFLRHTGVDPLAVDTASEAAAGGTSGELVGAGSAARIAELDRAVAAAGLGPEAGPALDPGDRDGRLDLLMSHVVEPRLARDCPTFVYDYPASQAALARLRTDPDGVPVAERFEVFVALGEGAIELANGFHELVDPAEQRRRFASDLARRRTLALSEPPVDERLLAALEAGLPDCAGVALGFDRLVMLAAGAASIDEVLAFPAERA